MRWGLSTLFGRNLWLIVALIVGGQLLNALAYGQFIAKPRLRQSAEARGSATPTVEANVLASALTAMAVGRLHRYARSGFKRLPTENLDPALARLT